MRQLIRKRMEHNLLINEMYLQRRHSIRGQDRYPSWYIKIYGLVDPSDPGTILYVGRTTNMFVRYKSHTVSAGNDSMGRWIRRLKRNGQLPLMILLSKCPSWKYGVAEETALIKMMRPEHNTAGRRRKRRSNRS